MPRKKFDLSLLPEVPNLEFERVLWKAGTAVVAGIDEAGRGALAGPVAAGVVILPDSQELPARLHGVRDSKQMSHKQREAWLEVVSGEAVAWQVGFAWPEEIDEVGIVPATRLAAMRALAKLGQTPGHLLIDAISIPGAGIAETSLVKGDRRSLSIACASIAAKVTRDAYMVAADAKFPGYGFAAHKGYGTRKHRRAIKHLGPSEIHRMSFSPMRGDKETDED
jgi:ribonuclease HII